MSLNANINANINNDALLSAVKPSVAASPEVTRVKEVANDKDNKQEQFSKTIKEAKRSQASPETSSTKPASERQSTAEKTAETSDLAENDGKDLPAELLTLIDGEVILALDEELEPIIDASELDGDEAALLSAGFVFEAVPKTLKPQSTDLELKMSASQIRPEQLSVLEPRMKGADLKVTGDLSPIETLVGTIKEAGITNLDKVEGNNTQNQSATRLAAATPTVEMSVPTKVGSKDWGESLAGRITLMVNQRMSSARIQLTPSDMGPIEIKVNLNNEQASVQFVSHSAQVRDALEQSIPRLREMLESAGFALADSDVSDQRQEGKRQESDDGDFAAEDPEELPVAQRETIGLVDQFV